MSLKSITDVIEFLGTNCRECEISMLSLGRYKNVKKRGKEAVFQCNWWHDHKRRIAFQTTPEQIKSLEQDVQELLKDAPSADTPSYEFREYFKRSDELIKKIRAYATFAPENLKMEINGYCHHCFKEVLITIEKNKVWIGCEVCASIIADSQY